MNNNKDISRRDFMKRMVGTGVLMATSSLPVIAEDHPELFPERGGFERLSLSYATIHIGLDKPFSVMHISDTHLTAAYSHENENKQTLHKRRSQTFGGRQEEALRDSLDWAKKHVDYIVHTGDLIDWQSEANFDLVRKFFGNEVFGTLGNHEYSPDMWLSNPKENHTEAYKDMSRDKLSAAYPFDIEFHSQVVNGVNFIGLDNVYGTVTERQVKRFREEVKKGFPIVLCMHVPIYTGDIWRSNRHFWTDNPILKDDEMPEVRYKPQQEDRVTREFIEYLKKEPLLKGILSGHAHITVEERFSETAMQYVVAGNFLFHARVVFFV